jgi:uncharacterized protein
VYENRLLPHDDARRRHLLLPPDVQYLRKPTGIIFVPVEHEFCSQYSDGEVCTILAVVDELQRCRLAMGNGERALTLKDILFVAPFNMQVGRLQNALGSAARVGSVDRFQGQEAPVVVISMCTSTLEDCPRGAEFLLNRNRLNVAVSRAQCLAIVVGSPGLAATRCASIEQMRLVNLYCRLMEIGGAVSEVCQPR